MAEIKSKKSNMNNAQSLDNMNKIVEKDRIQEEEKM